MLEASIDIKQSTFTTLILKQVEQTELAAMTFGFQIGLAESLQTQPEALMV